MRSLDTNRFVRAVVDGDQETGAPHYRRDHQGLVLSPDLNHAQAHYGLA